MRDYGEDGQLGLEETPEEYVEKLVGVFREVRRVLRDDGTAWLNLGDSYNNRTKVRESSHQPALNDYEDEKWADVSDSGGVRMSNENGHLKEKDLCMIPSRVAMALQEDGWWVRSRIVWHKPAPMPESVEDRPTSSHEYVFLLSKSKRYFYDHDAIREPTSWDRSGNDEWKIFEDGERDRVNDHRGESVPWEADGTGRNKRDVWSVQTKPFPDAHFAVYPPELIEPCVLAGTSEKGQCPKCGAPWERVIEKEFVGDNRDKRDDQPALEADESNLSRPPNDGGIADREFKGWEPTCDCCDHEPEPQTVLDPFSGAGTTGVVALAKGRDYVGIDLSREYCEMAAGRIRQDAPLMNDVEIRSEPPF